MKLTQLTPEDRERFQNQSLDEKIERAMDVIRQAMNRFDPKKSVVAWTGGKDSTLLLWLAREVCQERDIALPRALFIDEGDVFDEVREFVDKISDAWSVEVVVAHNEDVSSLAAELGDEIRVAELNERNRAEVKRLGYTEETFPYEPESYIGNHLMKTVATNIWLEEHSVNAMYVGVRWDEQEARSEDDFVRRIEEPAHHRVEPILAFTEQDVWDAIHTHEIPFVKLYEQGYRSLGARVTTEKTSDVPAWEQDLENTAEREGRRQDKEKIMKRLRDLGYM